MRVTRTTLKMFFQRSPAGQESAEALLEGLRHKYPQARIGGKERWKLTVPLGRGAFTIEQVLALLAELDSLSALSPIDASQTTTPADRQEALKALGYVE